MLKKFNHLIIVEVLKNYKIYKLKEKKIKILLILEIILQQKKIIL